MTATQAAMIMMSGSADLEDITITENGEYESVDHDGFGVVTVEVPTMVECAEEVAEILGVDTSQEWDCDDIKTKAQEVVDENEELKEENDELKEENESLQEQLDDCHDCKDQVVAAIQQYIPTYDPVPGECPAPKIPEVYQQGEEDAPEKYTFEQDPTDPTYPDPDFPDKIRDIIGNDNLTDDDVQIEVRYVDEPRSSSRHNIFYGFYTTDGTFLDKTQSFDTVMTDKLEGFKILDYTTGSYEFYWVMSPVDRYRYTGQSQNLIGYGDPTHSYTVSKNS